MTTFDGIILGIIGLTILLGFWKGLAKQVVGLAGVAVAYMMATRFYAEMAEKFLKGFSTTFGHIISFLVIFIACIMAASIVAWLVGKATNIAGLGIVNRFGGAFLGAVKGCFIVGVAIVMLIAFLPPDNQFLKDSKTIEYIQPVTGMISSFAPKSIKREYDRKTARLGRGFQEGR